MKLLGLYRLYQKNMRARTCRTHEHNTALKQIFSCVCVRVKTGINGINIIKSYSYFG